jgi:hypothetical protein
MRCILTVFWVRYFPEVIPNYSQQDATFLDLFILPDALNVSGGSSARRQEHVAVHTAFQVLSTNNAASS